MSLSGKIVTGAVVLLLAILAGIITVFHSVDVYNAEHPQMCISLQKLVNQNGSTLTFANGQVLDESQMVTHDNRKLGENYCVAWSRFDAPK